MTNAREFGAVAPKRGALAMSDMKYAALLAAPVLVLVSQYSFFQGFSQLLGLRLGYFLAFVLYWISDGVPRVSELANYRLAGVPFQKSVSFTS